MTEQSIYEKVADEALESSRNSMFIRWSDPEVGKTIAVGMGGEMRDALAMSNYHAALGILSDHVESGDITEDTVGRSGRTWMKVLSFRVYDDDGNITQAWKDAVDKVFLPLKDYPVLDEDDWSQREYDLFAEEIRFLFGDAAPAVLVAQSDAGLPFSIEEFDYDETLEAVEESLAAGNIALNDKEASALAYTVNQYRNRHDGEGLPTLTALIGEENL